MKKVFNVLIVSVIAVMIAGTLLQKQLGPTSAQVFIYHTPWFMALWILLLLVDVVLLVKQKLYRRKSVLMLHVAMGFIVIGMVMTTFTAKSGRLTLEEGKRAHEFVLRGQNQRTARLPFDVELIDFEIDTYPGTQAPQDFRSEIRFVDADASAKQAIISMNHIGRYKSYRFYQSSYDPSGRVTLTVAHDPWGITLTYIGYVLLLVSFVCFFFEKNSRFRGLLFELKSGRVATLVVLFCLLLPQVQAANAQSKPHTLSRSSANKMGQLYVMYNDRVCPLQTLAKDFTMKMYGAPTYKGFTSEQVLAGWLFYPSEWFDEPMVKVKGDAVQEALGLDGKYARISDFIDPLGNYRLEQGLSLPREDARRSKFLAADEKYNLVLMLNRGQLLKIFPVMDSLDILQWYSQADPLPPSIQGQEYLFIRQYLNYAGELVQTHDDAAFDELIAKTLIYQKKNAGENLPAEGRMRAERLTNRLAVGRPVAMGCVLLGLLLFGYSMVCLARRRDMNKYVCIIGMVLMAIMTLYLLLLFVLRWVVAEHVPMSNGYETMSFLALCVSTFALVLYRRHPMALPFGLLMTGFALLVAMMGGATPSVTRLMPVLSSPLLSIHVAVIMFAYALLAFVMLNGLAAIGLFIYWRVRRQSPQWDLLQRLSAVGQLLLYPAVMLLAVGIFVGAVWANISWGTYWSWDPKEVWALITLLIYATPLHNQYLTSRDHPMRFQLFAVLAFLSVLMTYFGVNLILGGMHSYA